MTTAATDHTDHLVTATAEITALAETASASFDGLSWDSSPTTLLYRLEAGKPVDSDDMTEGRYWPTNGSHESQQLERDWRDLLAAVDGVSMARSPVEYPAEVLTEARRLVAAEEAAVTARSDEAAELGRKSAELVGAGQWSDAIDAANQAAGIEREFGDSPAWGGLAAAIRALPEYRAAEQADEDYQCDSRSDDEIAASNTEEEALKSLAGLINAVEDAKLGITDATSESWGDRYVAAYRAEIAGWCAA